MRDAPLVPPGLLSRVVNYFHPRRVALSGSRARGEAIQDSDIDVLVIPDVAIAAAGLSGHAVLKRDLQFQPPTQRSLRARVRRTEQPAGFIFDPAGAAEAQIVQLQRADRDRSH